MKITGIRHAWPEKKGFNLYRRSGLDELTFLHFWKPVHILLGDKTVVTEPNAVVIIGKNVPHRFSSPDLDLVHDWFHFSGDDAEALLVSAGLETDRVYYPGGCGFITDLVEAMEAEVFGAEKNYETVIYNYASVLFHLLARRLEGGAQEHTVDLETQLDFKALRTRVFSNLDRSWNIAEMAEEINLSESRFYVLYKAIFKTTPTQDLIIARMDYAKQLLAQNNSMPIFDVAMKCGYTNEFHFIRQFKKHVGITPKKYALLHRI